MPTFICTKSSSFSFLHENKVHRFKDGKLYTDDKKVIESLKNTRYFKYGWIKDEKDYKPEAEVKAVKKPIISKAERGYDEIGGSHNPNEKVFEKFLNENEFEYTIAIVSDGNKEMRRYTVDGKTYGAFKKEFLERALEALGAGETKEDKNENKK